MTDCLLWYFESTQTDWITNSNSLLPGIFNLWICSFSKSDNPRIQHITHSFEWCTSIIPLLSIYTFCMIPRGTIDLFTLCSPVAWHSIAQKTVYKFKCLRRSTVTPTTSFCYCHFATSNSMIVWSRYYKRLCFITKFITKSRNWWCLTSLCIDNQILHAWWIGVLPRIYSSDAFLSGSGCFS